MDLQSQRWATLKEIFDAAVDLPPEQRAAYLGEMCPDGGMRAEVEQLLGVHEVSDGYLEPPDASRFHRLLDPPVHEGVVGHRIGQYRVERIVATGGMATVYEAVQNQPRRKVALKMMRVGLRSPTAVRRLQYESEILALLDHPAIARVYEAGTYREETNGRRELPYFAMEFVEGARDLLTFAREQQLGTQDRLQLFLRVCEAVHHGHQKGVVHRDLKPGNILVTTAGEPKVIDFGIARATRTDPATSVVHTQDGQILGTLQYMSPEQLSGDPSAVDIRADVYALGVVLYELLCDAPPYEIADVPIPEAARIIRECEPPRPSSVDRSIGDDLDWIVLRALEKDREARYASVSELAADVTRFTRHEPVLAGPPSAFYKLKKFVRRNKTPVGALALVLVSLAVGLIISLDLYFRAEREAEKARDVREFLAGILRSPDPKASGRDVKVVDALDRAAEKLDRAEGQDPEVAVFLRNVLCNTYVSLGMLEKAERQGRIASTLARAELPPENEEALAALSNHSVILNSQGKYGEAESLQRQILEVRRRTLGAADRRTLLTQANLAFLVGARGGSEEAEQLYRDAITRLTEQFGEADIEALDTRVSLGALLYRRGKMAEARAELERTLEMARESLGLENAITLKTMHNLASVLIRMSESAEAEELLRETLDVKRSYLGADEPSTLRTWGTLATVLNDRGDHEAAAREHGALLEARAARLGATHPETLQTKANLASTWRALGRVDDAAAALEEVVEVARDQAVPGRPSKLPRFLRSLALCRIDQERHADAEALLLESLELVDATGHGARSPEVQDALHALVDLYSSWGRPEQGESYRARLQTESRPER